MKAKTGLLTVVAAVLLVVCCAACSMTKTAMTASEFESRAKEAGFELVDAADQFQACLLYTSLMRIETSFNSPQFIPTEKYQRPQRGERISIFLSPLWNPTHF